MPLLRSILLAAMLLTAGCLSHRPIALGMTERDWLRRTLVADLVYMSDGITAYRTPGGIYYYFRDSHLVKIDQGRLPPQEIRIITPNKKDQTRSP